MHLLLDAWREYESKEPFVLRGDECLLEGTKLTTRCAGWSAYACDPDFGQPSGSSLHLDLLPMPFVGNLEKAKVYLLMLNPGLAPTDYYGEYNVPGYKNALLRNLKQAPESSFIFLDPEYSWHGGYLYWHSKLSKLVALVARELVVRYGEARRLIQEHVAVVELLPYHSATFGVPGRVLERLRSVELVRKFVQEVLVPKARSGQCLIAPEPRASGVCLSTKTSSVTLAVKQEQHISLRTVAEARQSHLSFGGRRVRPNPSIVSAKSGLGATSRCG